MVQPTPESENKGTASKAIEISPEARAGMLLKTGESPSFQKGADQKDIGAYKLPGVDISKQEKSTQLAFGDPPIGRTPRFNEIFDQYEDKGFTKEVRQQFADMASDYIAGGLKGKDGSFKYKTSEHEHDAHAAC